jgi:hypothetical protein
MPRILAAIIAALLLTGAAAPARAQAAAPTLGAALAGNTLAAVMFLPQEAQRGERLDRVVFQAFLRPDGSALIRRWDTARDAYTVPAEGHWRVSARTLCMDFPGLADGDPNICIDVHVWGPKIAGNTSGPGRFAMLDGDIEPGNSLIASR